MQKNPGVFADLDMYDRPARYEHGSIGHDGQLPGFNSFVGYEPHNDATVVVVTNVYSAPDGSQPANEITKLIIQELSSTGGGETTGASTEGTEMGQ